MHTGKIPKISISSIQGVETLLLCLFKADISYLFLRFQDVFQNIFNVSFRTSPPETAFPDTETLPSMRPNVPVKGTVHHRVCASPHKQ